MRTALQAITLPPLLVIEGKEIVINRSIASEFGLKLGKCPERARKAEQHKALAKEPPPSNPGFE